MKKAQSNQIAIVGCQHELKYDVYENGGKMFRDIIINHSIKLDIFWLIKTTINSSLKVLVEIAICLHDVFIRGKTQFK